MLDIGYLFRRVRKDAATTFAAFVIFFVTAFSASLLFILASSTLRQPLAFEAPNDVVVIWSKNPALQLDTDDLPISAPTYLSLLEGSKSFEDIQLTRGYNLVVGKTGELEQVDVVRTTAGFFSMLGVRALVGRTFRDGDDTEGAAHVAILSYDFASRRFSSPTNAVGETIAIANKQYEIIGVMPPRFNFPSARDNLPWLKKSVDVWLPLILSEDDRKNYGSISYVSFAKLHKGVTVDQATKDMDDIYRNLEKDIPQAYSGWSTEARYLRDQALGSLTPILLALVTASTVIVLIGLINYCILTIARSFARAREYALRQSLGALKSNIVVMQAVESLIISICATLTGLLLAFFTIGYVKVALASGFHQFSYASTSINDVLLMLVLAIVFASLLGGVPAMITPKMSLGAVIKGGGLVKNASQAGFIRSLFVTLQIALTIALVFSAILAGLSLRSGLNAKLGFNPNGLVAMQLQMPKKLYPDIVSKYTMLERLKNNIKNSQQGAEAAFAGHLPFASEPSYRAFEVEGQQGDAILGVYDFIDGAYFNILDVPMVEGRNFKATDSTLVENVAIINKELAIRFFNDGSAIGKRVKFADNETKNPWLRIVGVVDNIQNNVDNKNVQPQIYQPIWQSNFSSLFVISDIKPLNGETQTDVLARQVSGTNKLQPFQKPFLYKGEIAKGFGQLMLSAFAIALFSVAALSLSAVGLFGILSRYVLGKQREMAIRISIGATLKDNLKLLAQFLSLPFLGGLCLSVLIIPFMVRIMPGFEGQNLSTLIIAGIVSILIVIVVFAVVSLPQVAKIRRIDPMQIIRENS